MKGVGFLLLLLIFGCVTTKDTNTAIIGSYYSNLEHEKVDWKPYTIKIERESIFYFSDDTIHVQRRDKQTPFYEFYYKILYIKRVSEKRCMYFSDNKIVFDLFGSDLFLYRFYEIEPDDNWNDKEPDYVVRLIYSYLNLRFLEKDEIDMKEKKLK